MKSYLKESSFTMPDGESIVIRELSAGARRALLESREKSNGDNILFSAVAVKMSCPSYYTESTQNIMDSMTLETLQELAAKILVLSGVGASDEAAAEKN